MGPVDSNTLKMLHPKLVSIMRSYGYEVLTEVQERAIPVILEGYDTLIVAPTGSGKTEAALFPIISKILYNSYRYEPIAVIYVTPLRALNRDLTKRLTSICRDLDIAVQVRHGDTPYTLRKSLEKTPPHILITTPETLQYLLINKTLRNALANVRWVIIDEFHELLSSKRGAELITSLYRLELISGRFQKIALSASIGNIRLAKEILSYGRPVREVVIPYAREMDISVITPLGSELPTDRVQLIADLMNRHRQVIIFTNTRNEAEYLGFKLRELGKEVYVHHGSLSREERESVEEMLKKGLIKGVVATSSLELGIDIGSIDAVIQYSSPRQAVKLVQRVGRSMHRADLKAIGYVITDNTLDDILESLVITRRALNNDLEDIAAYECPLDVMAHQVVGLALQEGEVSIDSAYNLFKKSYIFRNLSYDDLNKLLSFLKELSLIKVNNGKIVATSKGKVYYLTTTMIVDSPHYDVLDMLSGGRIGYLDEEFVALELIQGSTLVLAGKLWRVVGIDEESRKIFVEEVSGEECMIPSWVGETIPVDYKVAREVCGIRKLLALNHLPEHYEGLISNTALKYVTEIVSNHLRRGYALPTENIVVIEVQKSDPSLIVIHACLGSKGNRGLGFLIGYLMSRVYGLNPLIKIDPYRVIIQLHSYLPVKHLENLIEYLTNANIDDLLIEALRKSSIYKHCLVKVLKRYGVIPEKATLNIVNALAKRYVNEGVVDKEVINELLTRYIDLKAIKDLIGKLKNSKTLVKVLEVSELSPLAYEGLRNPSFSSRAIPNYLPKPLIYELVKRRLMSKKIRLICLMCGYNYVEELKNLPDIITCPKCGVRYVGVSKDLSEDVVKSVSRGLEVGKNYKYVLSEEEKEVFSRVKESAYLVLNYGKKAAIALAAYGIGPETAKKVLTAKSEEDFYNMIYEFERKYVATRKYWET